MLSIVNNQRRLNSNNYKRIVINGGNNQDISIKVIGELINKFDTIKTSTPTFMEQNKNKNNIELIECVIEYFIRNNQINYINSFDRYKNNEGLYTTFGNFYSGREISLNVSELIKDGFSSLIKKYLCDRLKYVYEIIDDIELIKIKLSNETSYFTTKESETDYRKNLPFKSYYNLEEYPKKECLALNILKNNNEAIQFDKDFIIELIKYKIMTSDQNIEFKMIYSDVHWGIVGDIKLTGGNVTIEFPACFKNDVKQILIKREELTQKQMKLVLEKER